MVLHPTPTCCLPVLSVLPPSRSVQLSEAPRSYSAVGLLHTGHRSALLCSVTFPCDIHGAMQPALGLGPSDILGKCI